MSTINREHFEAWLFSQPDERTFNYAESRPDDPSGGCLVCRFLQSFHKAKDISVGGNMYSIDSKYIDFPEWMNKLMFPDFCKGNNTIIPFKTIKTRYLTLFPNAIVGNTPPEATVSKVESDSIAQESKTILATS